MYNTLLLALIFPAVTLAQDFELITREQWQAQPPKNPPETLNLPVPYVVIHHSYLPPACTTLQECIEAMQWMQNLHQINNSWNDIGYNFAVGSDGRVYEGRGWTAVGAHAPSYNNRSIGICLIGDWRDILPPSKQLNAVKMLIEFGVASEGFIEEEYHLIGHRQVKDTECPGGALFAEIQTWGHFDANVTVKWSGEKIDLKADGDNSSAAGLSDCYLVKFWMLMAFVFLGFYQ